MQRLLVILSLGLFAATIQAQDSFQTNSKVPEPLQKRIVETVLAGAPCIVAGSLQEVQTLVTVDHVDQGITDYYYDTYMTATAKIDSRRSSKITLIVQSSEADIDNPKFDPFLIESTIPALPSICK